MLLSFLGIYLVRGTFDFAELTRLGAGGLVPGKVGWLIFGGIFLGLAIKVPLFPFHTWLPDAYEAAPTGVSMVLTGVLSKMGVYGFIRLLLPLFPNETQNCRALAARARGLFDRVFVARGLGAARSETNDRLSLDQSPRLLPARALRRHRDARPLRLTNRRRP